jgi:acylphosphatase
MARVRLTVCDICGDRTKDAAGYTIKSDDGAVSVDLCATDAKPIEELLARIRSRPVARRPGRIPVTTIEEIEKLKAGSTTP